MIVIFLENHSKHIISLSVCFINTRLLKLSPTIATLLSKFHLETRQLETFQKSIPIFATLSS